jgi:hypothetical protein
MAYAAATRNAAKIEMGFSFALIRHRGFPDRHQQGIPNRCSANSAEDGESRSGGPATDSASMWPSNESYGPNL